MKTHDLNAERLAPLRMLAESREQDAARAMTEAQAQLADREDKLRQLEDYVEPELTGTISAAALLLNREAFRSRLSDAIAQQRRAVGDARARTDETREQWMERRRELMVIDQMIERSEQRERAAGERQSQRQMDEFSRRGVGGFAQ